MKRFLTAVALMTVLALMLACGSGGGEKEPAGDGGGAQEGQAPPVATSAATPTATPTAEPIPSPAAGLAEDLDELVLGEGDVPIDFSSLGNMDFDFDLDFLDLPTPQGMTAHMSMFATPDSEDMIVSMVILMEDDTLLEEAFSQMGDLSPEEMEEAFSMFGDYSDLGLTLLDTRELDVSSLGDQAYGMGFTMEMPQVGVMDCEMVFFGEGPVLAVAMTMNMGGGTAVDVRPLADTMADKIEAAVQ
jgi:hypothetical protein